MSTRTEIVLACQSSEKDTVTVGRFENGLQIHVAEAVSDYVEATVVLTHDDGKKLGQFLKELGYV